MCERDVEDAGAADRAEEADERRRRATEETRLPFRNRLLQEQSPLMALRRVRFLFFLLFS